MSDGAFHAYVGMLVVSALVLSVLAARGFGQSGFARSVDGVFAAVFLGYAGYLVIASPESVLVFYYAFLAPIYAVVHVVRNRSRGRAASARAGHGPGAYPPSPGGGAFPQGPGVPIGPPAPGGLFLPARPATSGSDQPVTTTPSFAVPAAYQPPAEPDYHPTPGYQTDQGGYAQDFGWTDQSRYPAGAYGDLPGRSAEPVGGHTPESVAFTDQHPAPSGYQPQTSYPAEGVGYSPQTGYPAEGAGYTPQAGFPAENPRYSAEAEHLAEDAGYPQPAADSGYQAYPMESPGYLPEAGHRAEEPWYPPAAGEAGHAYPPAAEEAGHAYPPAAGTAEPARPHTAAPGHRRADEPADPDRTAEWPRYQQ